jgi:regulator of cell morphogenesis and NO signaling
MKTITSDMTLKEIVKEVPRSGDMFRELRVDFVLNGDKTLGDVAEDKGLSEDNLLYEINEMEPVNEDGIDIKYMDEKSILKYIERKYHEDLKDELPVLETYLEKAVKQNKKDQPELEEVEELFKKVKAEVLEHIEQEERTAFKMLENYIDNPNPHLFEALKPYLTSLKGEHETFTQRFYEVRALTNDYTPHSNATGELRLVFQRLEKLEKDTFNHLFLEGDLLFDAVYDKKDTAL